MDLIDLLMQVSEASVSRNRSTIIVPAGSSRDEGWAAFRNILAEINEASRLFILPNQVCPCFPCINFSPSCFPCENISTSEITFSSSFLSLSLSLSLSI
jgi:hypothetical protein